MNAADLLARAERRALTVRLSGTAVKLAAVLGVALALYCGGERAGRASAARAELHAHLKTNARALAVARAREDTTKHAAVAATAHVDRERVATRAVEQRVAIVDSATVRLATVDSIYNAGVPPLVVAELAADRAQIHDDSLAITAWIANDSAQTAIITRLDERTQLLESAVKQETHASFWRGAKVGAVTAALAAIVLHVLLR